VRILPNWHKPAGSRLYLWFLPVCLLLIALTLLLLAAHRRWGLAIRW